MQQPGKNGAQNATKKMAALRLGEKSGLEAPRAGKAGQTVVCLERECHEENGSAASGEKIWRESPRKIKEPRGRRKTMREAPRTRGIMFNYAGAKKCCAPTQETGISPLNVCGHVVNINDLLSH